MSQAHDHIFQTEITHETLSVSKNHTIENEILYIKKLREEKLLTRDSIILEQEEVKLQIEKEKLKQEILKTKQEELKVLCLENSLLE